MRFDQRLSPSTIMAQPKKLIFLKTSRCKADRRTQCNQASISTHGKIVDGRFGDEMRSYSPFTECEQK